MPAASRTPVSFCSAPRTSEFPNEEPLGAGDPGPELRLSGDRFSLPVHHRVKIALTRPYRDRLLRGRPVRRCRRRSRTPPTSRDHVGPPGATRSMREARWPFASGIRRARPLRPRSPGRSRNSISEVGRHVPSQRNHDDGSAQHADPERDRDPAPRARHRSEWRSWIGHYEIVLQSGARRHMASPHDRNAVVPSPVRSCDKVTVVFSVGFLGWRRQLG